MAAPPDWSFDTLVHMRPPLDDSGMGTVMSAGADDFIVAAELGELGVLYGAAAAPPSWVTQSDAERRRLAAPVAALGLGFKRTTGQEMKPGEALASPTGYRLAFQTDGNLVIYNAQNQAIWSPNLAGKGAKRAVMQSDGNFVLYTAANVPVWSTATQGHPGAFIQIQPDANVVVYHAGKAIWQSDTTGGHWHKPSGGIFDDIGHLASEAVHIASLPVTLVKDVAKAVTNNPLWDIVQTGVSFIPGIGTAVSTGMSTMAAVGRSASIADIGLAAVRGALPGGALVQAAFDVAAGMALHGENITQAAFGAVRAQVGTLVGPALGPVAQAAQDLGVASVLGKQALLDPAVKAGLALMPKDPKLAGLFQVGAGLAKSPNVAPDVVARVKSIVPKDRASQAALQAGMLAARAKEAGTKQIDTFKKSLPVGKEGKAMLDAVHGASRAALATTHAAQLMRAKVALIAAMRLVRSSDLHDVRAKSVIDTAFTRAKTRDPHAVAMVQLFALARRTLKTHGQMIAGAWFDWLYTMNPAHDAPAWGTGEQALAQYSWHAPPRAHGNFLFSW